jgi:hypothetical protein
MNFSDNVVLITHYLNYIYMHIQNLGNAALIQFVQ